MIALLFRFNDLTRNAVCRVERQIGDFWDDLGKSDRIKSPWSGFREGSRYLGIPQNCPVRLLHAYGGAPVVSARSIG